MPYLIHIPPTHDWLPPTLHPFAPLGTDIGPLAALSSTSTLDLTLAHDFREWGWQVRYLDLSRKNDGASERVHGCGSIAQSEDGGEIGSVPVGSQEAARKWYEGYRKKEAKQGLRARLFRVWEQEHGRRIHDTKRQKEKVKKGLKERFHGLFEG
ncbi:hypothetical protein K458DRAFT_396237 [Lentithecium fluviatile CBS 122367]|uniref:Uncharacterized protein n=1 Tax=Lentithecium fluviatile CBS 122367 TaxID=1168545 RepID=A0A6G1IG04_9PLEO|nr:hypothetical protein K458DRAFT_396237 [Lentithecium fluviatile CBS 122367]